jgi:hypothetical protein
MADQDETMHAPKQLGEEEDEKETRSTIATARLTTPLLCAATK